MNNTLATADNTATNAINELLDAGRKMLAKKDSFSTWYDSMTAALPADYAKVEPSKCNPLPPYKTLLKNGTSEYICNLVEYVRQLTPARPKGRCARYMLPRFVETLEKARKAILGLLNEGESSVDFWEFLELNSNRKHELELEIRQHLSLDDCKRLDNIKVTTTWGGEYTLYAMSDNKTKNQLERAAGYTKTIEELAANIKGAEVKKETADEKLLKKIGIYRRWENGKSIYYVGAYSTGRVHLMLSPDFVDVDACKAFYMEHKEALCATLKEAGKTPALRVHVDLWRTAGETSQYANFTNEEFMSKFGLSGITYGNYVNNIARQAKLNATWDAFVDLANVLNIPAEKIGLSGLGLQFGASGTGHALAHFRQTDNSINLTRDRGDGALAHEWGHALDYRLRRIFAPSCEQDFATDIYNTETAKEDSQRAGLWLAHAAFRDIMGILMGRDKNSMLHRSERYGRGNKSYWANAQELFARAFEAYVSHKLSGINPYLVNFIACHSFNDTIANGTRGELSSYPYPTAEEMKQLAPLFSCLLDCVKKAL